MLKSHPFLGAEHACQVSAHIRLSAEEDDVKSSETSSVVEARMLAFARLTDLKSLANKTLPLTCLNTSLRVNHLLHLLIHTLETAGAAELELVLGNMSHCLLATIELYKMDWSATTDDDDNNNTNTNTEHNGDKELIIHELLARLLSSRVLTERALHVSKLAAYVHRSWLAIGEATTDADNHQPMSARFHIFKRYLARYVEQFAEHVRSHETSKANTKLVASLCMDRERFELLVDAYLRHQTPAVDDDDDEEAAKKQRRGRRLQLVASLVHNNQAHLFDTSNNTNNNTMTADAHGFHLLVLDQLDSLSAEHRRTLSLLARTLRVVVQQLVADDSTLESSSSEAEEEARRKLASFLRRAHACNPTLFELVLRSEPSAVVKRRSDASGKRKLAKTLKNFAAEHQLDHVLTLSTRLPSHDDKVQQQQQQQQQLNVSKKQISIGKIKDEQSVSRLLDTYTFSMSLADRLILQRLHELEPSLNCLRFAKPTLADAIVVVKGSTVVSYSLFFVVSVNVLFCSFLFLCFASVADERAGQWLKGSHGQPARAPERVHRGARGRCAHVGEHSPLSARSLSRGPPHEQEDQVIDHHSHSIRRRRQ